MATDSSPAAPTPIHGPGHDPHTTIFLVRHGQTRSNAVGRYMGRSDEDLDETGYGQACALTARLARQPVIGIYTSPVQRARRTAAILAEPHHLAPQPLEDITEIDLGEWQGHDIDEVRQRWPELWRQSRIDPSNITMPGGESFAQVAVRAVRAFRHVAAGNHGGLSVIVTHDIIIRIMVAHVLGVATGIYRRLEVGNASLSVVRVVHGYARLLALNDTAHLADWGAAAAGQP